MGFCHKALLIPRDSSRFLDVRLDHHRDEVWFASITHDGRLLASSSKDRSRRPIRGAAVATEGPLFRMKTRTLLDGHAGLWGLV